MNMYQQVTYLIRVSGPKARCVRYYTEHLSSQITEFPTKAWSTTDRDEAEEKLAEIRQTKRHAAIIERE